MLKPQFVPKLNQLAMSMGEALFCSLHALGQFLCLERSLGIVVIGDVDTQLHPCDISRSKLGIQSSLNLANEAMMHVGP